MIEATAKCPVCHRERMVTRDGVMRKHRGRSWEMGTICKGSGVRVRELATESARVETRGHCIACARSVALTLNGAVRKHQHQHRKCIGSGQFPMEHEHSNWISTEEIRSRALAFFEHDPNGVRGSVEHERMLDRDSAFMMLVRWLEIKPRTKAPTEQTFTAYYGKHVFEKYMGGHYVSEFDYRCAAHVLQIEFDFTHGVYLVALPSLDD